MEATAQAWASRQFRPNYAIIPAVALAVSLLGSFFTSLGMPWYRTLTLPDFTPPGSVIGTVWTGIYILSAISALLIWNRPLPPMARKAIGIAWVANALLNVAWSFIFFTSHQILLGFLESGLLALSVAVLITMLHPFSKLAAWLLTPYLAWVSFATYLNYSIWQLNR